VTRGNLAFLTGLFLFVDHGVVYRPVVLGESPEQVSEQKSASEYNNFQVLLLQRQITNAWFSFLTGGPSGRDGRPLTLLDTNLGVLAAAHSSPC
jgi:hypothetical protein